MTVHLVFNAHLDPVWLWPWQYGLDEALATCRSACDRLDANPDLVFTRGEAWVYRQVEEVDPELFGRIRRHVEGGRWEIVGGWWIQPDCNGPSAWAMDWQVELGKEYFESRFGRFPRVAYNVDSFGHSAALPALMRRHGQDRYVMMRPQEHEMALPARTFRWRGYEDGPEVTVFRIAGSYAIRDLNEEHVLASLTGLPPGLEHTMCFIGVGDHGGGPTEEQIAWCLEHTHAIPGVKLVFSSPSRFFEAIEGVDLPLVVGELQQHAVGCYSVHRPIKTAVRRAEHLLVRSGGEQTRAKEYVCFAHFHDTYGGTCIPSAYPQILDRLGYACAVADEALQIEFRRKMLSLPDDERQRIVAWNPSDSAFDGFLTHDPWLDWRRWDEAWRLVDQNGQEVPYQRIRSEAMVQDEASGLPRILLHARLEPEELRVWYIEPSGRWPMASLGVRSDHPEISLHLIADPSDTWSHGLDRYGEVPLQVAKWGDVQTVEEGPLRTASFQEVSFGDSRALALWSSYPGEPYTDLELRFDWRERHRLLKLVVQGPIARREDGIMGGSLVRPLDGRERPIRDWVLTDRFGVVCPDVFAADGTADRLRLTILRSPLMAHHDPHPGYAKDPRTYADQGEHIFRFRFFTSATREDLEKHAMMLQRPPLTADLTRGMRPTP